MPSGRIPRREASSQAAAMERSILPKLAAKAERERALLRARAPMRAIAKQSPAQGRDAIIAVGPGVIQKDAVTIAAANGWNISSASSRRWEPMAATLSP